MASCECGRKWTGNSECHCASCHSHFTSDSAFIAHLASPQSDDACYPPSGITRKDGSPALELIERTHGDTWRIRRDDEHPFSHLPPSPGLPKNRVECSWCRTVTQDGISPVSHTICASCSEALLKDAAV